MRMIGWKKLRQKFWLFWRLIFWVESGSVCNSGFWDWFRLRSIQSPMFYNFVPSVAFIRVFHAMFAFKVWLQLLHWCWVTGFCLGCCVGRIKYKASPLNTKMLFGCWCNLSMNMVKASFIQILCYLELKPCESASVPGRQGPSRRDY